MLFNFLYVHFNNFFHIPVQLSSRPIDRVSPGPKRAPLGRIPVSHLPWPQEVTTIWLLSLTVSSAYSWTLHKQNHKYVLFCVWLHLLSPMPIDLFMLLCVPALISDLRIIQFSLLLWSEMSPFLLLQGLVAFMDWFNFATQFNELEMTGVVSIRKLRWLIF